MTPDERRFHKALGKNLKALRLKRGDSHREVARNAEVSPPMIGNLERGEHSPTIYMLSRVCSALQCEIGDVLPPAEVTDWSWVKASGDGNAAGAWSHWGPPFSLETSGDEEE